MASTITQTWKKFGILMFVLCGVYVGYHLGMSSIATRGTPIPAITNFWSGTSSKTTTGRPQVDNTNKSMLSSYKYDLLCRSSDNSWHSCRHICQTNKTFELAQLRTAGGNVPMYIHNMETDKFVSASIKNAGVFEPGKVNEIWKHLQKYPDAVFVDIGSQIGQYSFLAAKAGHRAVAVDPVVSNLQHVCKTVSINTFKRPVTAIYGALSNDRANISLVKRFQNNIGATQVNKTGGTVPCHRLDDLLPLVSSEQVIIKMDTEGHESKILEAASEFFKKNTVKVVMMEWYFYDVLKYPSVPFILKFMKDNNLVPHHKSVSTRLDPAKVHSWGYDDIFWLADK